MEDVGDKVVDVDLGLLVLVGQHVRVVVLLILVVVLVVMWRRRWAPCSMTRQRRVREREILVTEEARLLPRILLGAAPGVPLI